MPTNWKKNNPGLVSLSCWLAAPSYCGGCSCLLDRGLALCSLPSHPALAFVNPPPSISATEPRVGELEGLTEPPNAWRQLQTQFPSLFPQTMQKILFSLQGQSQGVLPYQATSPSDTLKPLLPLSTISCLNSVFGLTPSTPIFSCPILSSPSAPVLETTFFFNGMCY